MPPEENEKPAEVTGNAAAVSLEERIAELQAENAKLRENAAPKDAPTPPTPEAPAATVSPVVVVDPYDQLRAIADGLDRSSHCDRLVGRVIDIIAPPPPPPPEKK